MKDRSKKLERIDEKQFNLDLFSLDPMIDKNYSNTLEIYDLAGKFVYDRRVKYMREAKASDTVFTRTTHLGNIELQISVTAANIERTTRDGVKEQVFVFPGVREEIIEDVLRKLITEEDRPEAYNVSEGDYSGHKLVGVSFSLYEIHKELKRVDKTYSYAEIREALEIMNTSFLKVRSEDDSLYLSAPFFPIMLISEKAKNPEQTRSFICFHPLVTELILNKKFRRYNYVKSLEFGRNYSRLMYKRLSHRWVQASPEMPYRILLSTIVNAFKTPNVKLFKDKELFNEVMKELQKENVISHYELAPKKEGRKIIDWLFTLYPTDAFSKQQAANNKVENRIKSASTQKNKLPYDQS